MNVRALALIVFAAMSASARAYEPDVTQERMEWDTDARSDQLTPSGSRMPDEGPLYYLAKFGNYPSFSDAYEWVVVLKDGKYTLSSWRIAKGDKIGAGPKRLDLKRIELSQEIAAAIYRLWSNAILNARYSRAGTGLDGTSYFFSTWLRGVGWPSATTWSPGNNIPPSWMVEAGEAVGSYARGKEHDAKDLLSKLQAISSRIDAYERVRVSGDRPNKSLERTRGR